MTDLKATRDLLLEQREAWSRRMEAIRSDRRRAKNPLEKDFAEQAVQRENDETLDALDARGREALASIERALARMDAGTYGKCLACGDEIEYARLRARPTAPTCRDCAD